MWLCCSNNPAGHTEGSWLDPCLEDIRYEILKKLFIQILIFKKVFLVFNLQERYAIVKCMYKSVFHGYKMKGWDKMSTYGYKMVGIQTKSYKES